MPVQKKRLHYVIIICVTIKSVHYFKIFLIFTSVKIVLCLLPECSFHHDLNNTEALKLAHALRTFVI